MDLRTNDKGTTKTRAKTGISGLDEILEGGLPSGHFYLVEGHPGTGKTTLALQFLLAGLDNDESGLYVSLSESKSELIEVARAHGWNLENLSLFELLTYLSQMGVATFIILVQHGLIGGPLDSNTIDVSYIADSAIVLRYFESSGQVRKAISVLKKRSGSHEHFIRELSLISTGIHVGPPLQNFRGILGGNPEYLGDPEGLSRGDYGKS
ncbi:MAG: hypothetical protein H7249_03310 [Chitinophagaceae bacterium]|nr:hypothetical protein [Oligoflexus sp.]